MYDIVATAVVIGLMFLLFMGVIYEPAWREILRSREARRRREDHAREGH